MISARNALPPQILDKPNAANDRQLARHLVSLYYKVPVVPASPLAQDFLMDYIAYARRHIQPEVRYACLPLGCLSRRKSCLPFQCWHDMLCSTTVYAVVFVL